MALIWVTECGRKHVDREGVWLGSGGGWVGAGENQARGGGRDGEEILKVRYFLRGY